MVMYENVCPMYSTKLNHMTCLSLRAGIETYLGANFLCILNHFQIAKPVMCNTALLKTLSFRKENSIVIVLFSEGFKLKNVDQDLSSTGFSNPLALRPNLTMYSKNIVFDLETITNFNFCFKIYPLLHHLKCFSLYQEMHHEISVKNFREICRN